MSNLLSYCGLVDARISASDKDLPVAETGFPGKPRISLDFSFHFKVANVVGFPGFIQTRPK